MRTLCAGLAAFLGKIAIVANAIGTFVILVLVGVLNYDVVARGVFNAPFHGAVEVVQFSMVLIVFLQLPDVVRVGRLTRSDGFLLAFGGNRPALEKIVRRIVNGVAAIFMLLVVIAIWPEFTEAWERNDYFGIPGVFTSPWWPVKLTIFISAVLCTALFVLKTIFGEDHGMVSLEQQDPTT